MNRKSRRENVNGDAIKGKRAFQTDRMNVATGQARLFGTESQNAAKENMGQRKGKRAIQMPAYNGQIM